MPRNVLPKSLFNWWSVGLVVTWLVVTWFLFIIFSEMLLGSRPNYSHFLLAWAMTFLGIGIAVFTFVTGIIIVVRRRKWWIAVGVVFILIAVAFFVITRPWIEPLHAPSYYQLNTPGQPTPSPQ